MLALQITAMKPFMNELLTGDAFDIFLLEEASLVTAVSYEIDGRIRPEFYPPSERDAHSLPYAYKPWSEIKGLCFDLIKGKHTPLSFKFVLQLKPEKLNAMLEKEGLSLSEHPLKSLILTIRFDGSKTVLTTGSSYQTFVLD